MLRQKPDPSPPYAGARTSDNRIDPSPATKDKNEMKQLPSRNEADYAGKELSMRRGGKVTKVVQPAKAKARSKSKRK